MEKFAPVANNTTTQLILAVTLQYTKKGWICMSVDIKAAFLEGYNKGMQFMDWPPGSVELSFATTEEIQTTCLRMLQCIYGNVEAALTFYTTYANHLIQVVGMTQSKTNACLFFKKNDTGNLVLIVCCHVDNTLIVGKPKWAQYFKDKVWERFSVIDLGRLQKHLGI